MTPVTAYNYAIKNHKNPDFNLEHYQKIVCEDSELAYYFAYNIPGADIKYCQEHACKDMQIAYLFALEVPGADIEYCRKSCGFDPYWLNEFDKMIIEKAIV